MDIVIIGSGNIAWCYGQQLRLNGHVVQQVISRQAAHAQALGEMLNAAYTTDLLNINMEADVYLLAVSDDALGELNDALRLGRRMVAHTAGAVSLEAIAKISTHTGVVYPLQSIRKENKNYPEIPIIIEASNDETLRRLQSLAQSISPKVSVASSAQRLQLHLAAVLANNFTNHLVTLSKTFCQDHGLDFGLLQPILRETFERLEKFGPENVQTGPALRGDQHTMALHESLLADQPTLKAVYQVLSASIAAFYQ
ncbi:Predicted oxidoreductase, contains short-chain dehydrogenase (SDR) and DUF2520 domains [Chitinophaga costaii]|uniref:Predicted oxidoreductase, contains short-chain dehydrogenase (SDR) and DUF2520 domains n=1 Tax=Chitinophaga costaii TaxID=1335309 RepID=A0A1C3ZBJ1_9BACT|nr:DUF2520 domain-containing protein [Chitinophaga costaii]PUZ30307.1 DUF2520 domain-containing protein [Chitinophaga costaii]SCB79759.1 Predicted oxidoreductase, contains short-chain dehydrogenase (SDR) and DUF2520 domains [Chitinophaga costaii]